MRIISRNTLRAFWDKHADAEQPLKSWFKMAKGARWNTPLDVKASYANASILQNGRVVFNIGGNKYRLITAIDYRIESIFIKFVGTHREYDKVDAQKVSLSRKGSGP